MHFNSMIKTIGKSFRNGPKCQTNQKLKLNFKTKLLDVLF